MMRQRGYHYDVTWNNQAAFCCCCKANCDVCFSHVLNFSDEIIISNLFSMWYLLVFSFYLFSSVFHIRVLKCEFTHDRVWSSRETQCVSQDVSIQLPTNSFRHVAYWTNFWKRPTYKGHVRLTYSLTESFTRATQREPCSRHHLLNSYASFFVCLFTVSYTHLTLPTKLSV